MDVYSITEGRKKLGELVNLVKYQHKVIALGKNGRADVLIVAYPTEDEEVPTAAMAEQGRSFDFLEKEPDLYSVSDLKKRY